MTALQQRLANRRGSKKLAYMVSISKSMKVRDVLKVIAKDGWPQIRQTGSHRHFHHATKPGTVTVAGHPSIELAPKTEAAIMKQAGSEKRS